MTLPAPATPADLNSALPALTIERLEAFADNYLFLLWTEGATAAPADLGVAGLGNSEQRSGTKGTIAAVVDPGDPAPILARLESLGAELVAILNTHHHHDHIGGNRALLERFPQAQVYGGAEDLGRIPGQTVALQAGDRVGFGGHIAEVLFLPGHTRAHIAYYFPGTGDLPGNVFCGDTLFGGGCGRLFEGTPAQMLASLDQLAALPDATRVWCAHEYTLGNLTFAQTIDRDNPALADRYAQVQTARRRHEATIPSTIGIEKATNPFLRCDRPEIQAAVGVGDRLGDPVAEPHRLTTFRRLRGRKDLF